MFLLRCAFWLSVVYSTMTWTNIGIPSREIGTQAVAFTQSVGTDLVQKAVAGATDYCTRHASECAADAARLTALASATDDPTVVTGPAFVLAASDASVPLPIPDPRRLRDAKTSRTP